MTQRRVLTSVTDRLAIDDVITGYAVAVDDGDWPAYRALFAPGGRADYRSAGGIEGGADEVATWLTEMMRLFPMRQHLIVNRRIQVDDPDRAPGDGALVLADYVNPMRLDGQPPDDGGSAAPNFFSGGRYTFTLLRSDSDWQVLNVVVHEKWRRDTLGARAGE